MVRLGEENSIDWNAAEQVFHDLTARDALVGESRQAERVEGQLTFSMLKEAALRGGRLPTGSGVIPFAAIRLYRALMSRNAIAFSQLARAARTPGEMKRSVGDFDIDVISETDATFIIITPIAESVPTALTLLGNDGRVVTLDLPEPIGEAIQIGLADDGADGTLARELIDDPMTAIFIQ